MDILYVLGRGSRWNNNELRYSLRSIEKFAKNVGRVYVVGYDPGFLSDKVTFIPCPNRWNIKHKNILNAIVFAVNNSNIGEEFLYSSDDHFYVKEVDFDNYPYYYRGDIPNKILLGEYMHVLHDTRTLLETNGYTTFRFNWHGNTHFSRKGIEKAKDLIEYSFTSTQYGVEPTNLILNVVYSYDKFEMIKKDDLKIRIRMMEKDEIKNLIGDNECFSTPDIGIEFGIADYLKERFPNKSIYEK